MSDPASITVSPGHSDDAKLIQAAINRSRKVMFAPGTYHIGATLVCGAGTELIGGKGVTIILTTPDINIVAAVGKSAVRISGIAFVQATQGKSASVGAVHFQNCTLCAVEDCIFTCMQWSGVLLNESDRCLVARNRFQDFQATLQDSADITIYNEAKNNVITDNECAGGADHGILIQDPYAGRIPTDNLVAHNEIRGHKAYGVAVYLPGVGGRDNSRNRIIANRINAISGSARGGAKGAGIYVVGSFAGGTVIVSNTVSNCCIETRIRTLVPAAIGINGVPAGPDQIIVSNNKIMGMVQGDGITISSSSGGAALADNTVELPPENNGSGPGGLALQGSGIYIHDSSNVSVARCNVSALGGGRAFFAYADDASQSSIDIDGGQYLSASASTVGLTGNGTNVLSGIRIVGITARNTGHTNYAIDLAGCDNTMLENNVAIAQGFDALRMSACRNTRIVGGSYSRRNTPRSPN
ncbi:hypothetical protein GRI58_11365 [Porphyrobacter algicida]|uniref:Periplasmic copper-binding protein NosD beta helix domain-containing protein n=1 Tax=Qipengyuania algicida TaxID=1836209 RepID=A0A845AKL1_9SPHN|nr:right-handed parallel beta-helix repeat-containing protein [Qipengyuania algicida]MXP29421.1 hypothetical protein [Qipengyuania algicida]